jgi:hypothetical protein
MSDEQEQWQDTTPTFITIGDEEKHVPEFAGVYIGREESKQFPGTMLLIMLGEGGKRFAISANAALLDKVAKIGQLYKIIFDGRRTPKGGGKPYKVFKILEGSDEARAKYGYRAPASAAPAATPAAAPNPQGLGDYPEALKTLKDDDLPF